MSTKYIVAREWGFGFWADVNHILGVCLLSEITNRIPIAYWGPNSLFSCHKEEDAFSRFFKPLSPFPAHDLIGKGYDYFGDEWSDETLLAPFKRNVGTPSLRKNIVKGLLGRTERVVVSKTHFRAVDLLAEIPYSHSLYGLDPKSVYRWLCKKYLKPNPDIVLAADSFHQRHLEGKKFIAVHIRGSDKQFEVGELLQKVNRTYFDLLEPLKDRDDWNIFVLTESQPLLDEFIERFGEKVVFTDCHRTAGNEGIHYSAKKWRSTWP